MLKLVAEELLVLEGNTEEALEATKVHAMKRLPILLMSPVTKNKNDDKLCEILNRESLVFVNAYKDFQ